MTGHIAALSASALWAVASIIFTRLRAEMSATSLNLVKTGLALLFMVLTMVALRGQFLPTGLSHTEIAWLGLSGIVGLTIGDTLLFEALSRIGPRRSLLFMTLAPPITAILAWPVLNEPITGIMAVGIGVTLLGIALVIMDREDTNAPSTTMSGYFYAAGAALCQALGNVATKLGGEHDPLDMSMTRIAFGSLALLIYISIRFDLRRELVPMKKPSILRAVIIATILGTYLGIWLQVTGLRYAPAGIAATLSSTSPIFILPLAAIFLNDRIRPRTVVSALIAVTGIGLLFL